MSSLLLRALGAVLVIVGLAAAVVGGWFIAQLGTDGTARFTTRPDSRVVVLGPSVLNRVDHDVTLEATTTDGSPVWMGLARPSDVDSVLGEARVTQVTGVSVRDGELRTRTTGDGDSDPRTVDLWQEERVGDGSVSSTVDQDAAPQTLVVAAEEGQGVEELTMTVSDPGWFTRALVLTLLGLVLLALGALLLVRSLLRRPGRDDGVEAAPGGERTTGVSSTAVGPTGSGRAGSERSGPGQSGSSVPEETRVMPVTAPARGGETYTDHEYSDDARPDRRHGSTAAREEDPR